MYKSVSIFKNFLPNCNNLTKISVSLRTLKIRKMVSVGNIPKVDIDPAGVFKYILINVYDKSQNEAVAQMMLVRGYKRCEYHSDIFDEVQEKLKPLDCEPLGGGRISHDSENKKIHIYGYSQGYGKADHEITAKLVKEAFPGYTISISDEGDPPLVLVPVI